MFLRQIRISCVSLLVLALWSANAIAEDVSLPPNIVRWGSLPIVKDEVFISLPPVYPMAVASELKQPGLYVATYYPRGQSKDNWSETLRLMAFQGVPNSGDSPAKQMLQFISLPVKAACPSGFFLEEREQKDSMRASATMGCRRLERNSTAGIYGYYLVIQGQESMYVLAREFRSQSFDGGVPTPKEVRITQETQLDKTTICRRNEICVK